MGRSAGGVSAIKLAKDDHVTSMEVIEPGGDLIVITSGGYGKRTPLKEYAPKGRATKGMQTIDLKAIQKIGLIVSARVVQENDDLTIISANGVVMRMKVKDISQKGRAARGTLVMQPQSGDTVATLARMAYAEPGTPESDNGDEARK